jgi:hypothetical protein
MEGEKLTQIGEHGRESLRKLEEGAESDHFIDSSLSQASGISVAPSMVNNKLLSSMSTILLAFVLILSLWDTWSTLTDIVAPMETHLGLRCLLNAVLFSVSVSLVSKFREKSKRLVILGNLLAGVGIWEFTEALIEAAFGGELVLKFLFYGSCLSVTYAIIVYLESTNRLNVVDSGFLSPI